MLKNQGLRTGRLNLLPARLSPRSSITDFGRERGLFSTVPTAAELVDFLILEKYNYCY